MTSVAYARIESEMPTIFVDDRKVLCACFDVEYIQALRIRLSDNLSTFATNFRIDKSIVHSGLPTITKLGAGNITLHKYTLATLQKIENPTGLMVMFRLPVLRCNEGQGPVTCPHFATKCKSPLKWLLDPTTIPMTERLIVGFVSFVVGDTTPMPKTANYEIVLVELPPHKV